MSTEYNDMNVILVKAKADKELAKAAEIAEVAKKAAENKEILKSVVNEPEPVASDTTKEEEVEVEVSEDAVLASDEENQENTEVQADEPAKQPRSKAAEKRIAKLVKEREQLKGQLNLLQNNQQSSQSNQVPQQIPIDPSIIDPAFPNPANYKDGVNDIDYRLDVREYQREQAKKDINFKTAIKAAIEKYPDLPELIAEDASRTNATMAQMIKESPVSADLFYYLMANPEVSNKIAEMSPTQSAKEIGKIEAKLEDKAKTATPSAKKVANLPAPLTPIKSTKAAGTSLKQSKYTVY